MPSNKSRITGHVDHGRNAAISHPTAAEVAAARERLTEFYAAETGPVILRAYSKQHDDDIRTLLTALSAPAGARGGATAAVHEDTALLDALERHGALVQRTYSGGTDAAGNEIGWTWEVTTRRRPHLLFRSTTLRKVLRALRASIDAARTPAPGADHA